MAIDLNASSTRFFDWLERKHAEAPLTAVGKIMTANNYSIAHTGGGCLVWERMIDSDYYLWICDQNSGLGTNVDESFIVGCYNADGDFDNAECKGIQNAIRWCNKRHADPAKFIAVYQDRLTKRLARERGAK